MDSIFNSKIGGIPGLIKSFFSPQTHLSILEGGKNTFENLQSRIEGMNLSACSVNRLDVSALLSS